MSAIDTKTTLSRPRHHVTAEDYPGEWARNIELYLDDESRRIKLYGGLFGVFALTVAVAALIAALS